MSAGSPNAPSEAGPSRRPYGVIPPPMRIALLQPTFPPEAGRGRSRMVHDLARSLAARGHDTTVLTSHRGRTRSTRHGQGLRVIRRWRPPERTPLTWYEHHVANIPGVLWHLRRSEYDVAHAFFPAEGWAALHAQRFGGPPVVFSFQGLPARPHLVGRRYRLEMVEALARGADVVTVPSEAARVRFRAYFARDPVLLPIGVRVGDPPIPRARAPEPTLLCAACSDTRRTRFELLLSAFELLRRRHREARLRLLATPSRRAAAPRLPAGVDWAFPEDAARALASSWGSVLPAVDEGSGLMLLESLAAGTPVVASRSGACPEIVDDDRIGRLFESDDAPDLARCMDEVLVLASSSGTSAACRDRAARHDWTRVMPRYEELYLSLARRSDEEAGPAAWPAAGASR